MLQKASAWMQDTGCISSEGGCTLYIVYRDVAVEALDQLEACLKTAV